MSRLTWLISWANIISGIVIIGFIFFWSYYPYNILEFQDSVYPVETKTVKPGEEVIYRVRYCKYLPTSFSVTRKFVDGIIYTTSEVASNNPVGCHDNLVYIQVPKSLPEGNYSLQMIYRTKVNPIRTVEIIRTTERFTVKN